MAHQLFFIWTYANSASTVQSYQLVRRMQLIVPHSIYPRCLCLQKTQLMNISSLTIDSFPKQEWDHGSTPATCKLCSYSCTANYILCILQAKYLLDQTRLTPFKSEISYIHTNVAIIASYLNSIF